MRQETDGPWQKLKDIPLDDQQIDRVRSALLTAPECQLVGKFWPPVAGLTSTR